MPGLKTLEVQDVLLWELWIQAEMQCAIRPQREALQLPEYVRIDAVRAVVGWRLELLNLDQNQLGPCWQRSIRCCCKIQEFRDLVFEPGAVDTCVLALFEAFLF